MERYILVEGLNIGANIYDTNQLSVVRGGSFLLKKAIVSISRQFSNKITVLSEGASSGFFQVKDSNDGQQLCDDIVEYLERDDCFALLTFGVESCQAASPQEAKEILLTRLRCHQLQGPTLVPDCAQDSSGPSDWSGIRAKEASADKVTYGPKVSPDKEINISQSEKRRWKYGREKKQSYYLEEVISLAGANPHQALIAKLNSGGKDNAGYHFTRDLNELSGCNVYPDLSGKIAVFYADGNSFGSLQQELIEKAGHDKTGKTKARSEAEAQQDFDRELQRLRQAFLAKMLENALPNYGGERFPHMDTTTRNDNNQEVPALRLETLLWGGDEMLFVMPAWIGFDFVQFFFEQTRDWKIQNQRLTHSAGLVLCSAKTPIRITRQLAQVIADHIKNETAATNKGKRNAWDYMVLESIDYPAHMDYGRFIKERYGKLGDAYPLCIEPGDNWSADKDAIRGLLRDDLPTRQLYGIVQWLTRQSPKILAGALHGWQPPDDSDHPLLEQENRLLAVCDNKENIVRGLCKAGELFSLDVNDPAQRAWIWLHLVELKDYIAPRRDD